MQAVKTYYKNNNLKGKQQQQGHKEKTRKMENFIKNVYEKPTFNNKN